MSEQPPLSGGLPARRPDFSPAFLAKRRRAERRFKFYGLAAVSLALGALVFLLASIVVQGQGAFRQSEIALDIVFAPEKISPNGARDPQSLAKGDYLGLVKDALKAAFPDIQDRGQRKQLFALLSSGAGDRLREMVLADPSRIGMAQRVWLLLDDRIDLLLKKPSLRNLSADQRGVSDQQLVWLDAFAERGAIRRNFNIDFLTSGDSREPEQAGILGALMGSLFTMLVALLLSLPLGVMSAIYLEEFAPRHRLTDLIEININNLAAVPSIVFGLLGLALLLGVFGLPRSSPLVGGMVLSLMTLPTIIIATRAALKAVPPSIREAAYGIGASPLQVVLHHVLPLAVPGIMTGSIIGMARALGESAPLLMIGMVAFIVDVPHGPLDPATVLPVQIYLWADSPERGFVDKTSAAILVLLIFLIAMNAIAIYVRRKFERRW